MSNREYKFRVALDDAGVKSGVKGVEKEVAQMRKSFESLQKIKAFKRAQEDLKGLKSELDAARNKVTRLASEQKKSRESATAAYSGIAGDIRNISKELEQARVNAETYGKSAQRTATASSKAYVESRNTVAALHVELVKAKQAAKDSAEAAKKGGGEHKKAAGDAKVKVAQLTASLEQAKGHSKLLGEESKRASNALSNGVSKSRKEVIALEKALSQAKQKSLALAKESEKSGKKQQAAYKKAVAEVDKLTKSVRTQTGELAKQSSSLKASGVSTRQLSAEQKKAEQQLKKNTAELKAATKVQEFYAKTGVRSYSQISREIKKLNKDLRKLKKEGKLGPKELARAEAAATKKTKELRKELNGLSADTKGLNGRFRAGAAAASVFAISLDSIGKTAKFTDELAAVEALTGASADEMQRLKDKAFELAGAAGGPTAAAAAMAELATAGQDVNNILFGTKAVRDMANASRGTLSFAQAGNDLTDILNLSGRTMEDAEEASSKLVKGWTSASQSAPELIRGVKEILGLFTAMYGKEEGLTKSIAAVSGMADVGFKGSKGGRMLKNAFLRLIKPTSEVGEIMKGVAGAEADVMGGAEAVLEKHKELIQVYDETGKMRDYADILDDIGNASLSEADSLALFGRIAGPGMFGQVGKGGQAITDLEEKINNAGGTSERVSAVMQSRLGGSIRAAAADIEKAQIVMTEDFEPALQGVLKVTGYADNVASGFAGTVKTVAAVSLTAAGGVFKLASISAKMTDTLGLTSGAADEWRFETEAAFGAAADLGNQAATSFKKAKGEVDPLIESQKAYDKATASLANTFTKVTAETGVTITSMKDLDAAVASGAIRYDDAAGKWVGAEKEKQEAATATRKAAEAAAEASAKADKKGRAAAKKAWQEYADLVKKITGEIVDRSDALTAQLNEMARSGMSVAEAQRAIKEEARAAAVEAERLAKAGDTEGALKAADASREAWAEVAGDVRGAASDLDAVKAKLKEAEEEYKKLKKTAKKDKIVDKDEKDAIRAAKKEVEALRDEVKESEKALKDEKNSLKEAMAGVKQAGELGIDILEKQKAAAEENRDALDEAFDFSAAEEAIDKLIEDKLSKAGEPLAESMAEAGESAVADIEKISAKEDEFLNKKRVLEYQVKEVAAAAGGAAFNVAGAASGAAFAGKTWRDVTSGYRVPGSPSRVDTFPAMIAKGETVTNSAAASLQGYEAWSKFNKRDLVGGIRAIIKRHPHLHDAIAPRPAAIVVPKSHRTPAPMAVSMPSNQGKVVHVTVINQADGSQYNMDMTPESYRIWQESEARKKKSSDRFKV